MIKKALVGFILIVGLLITGNANAAIITTATGIDGYSWLTFDVTLGMSRDYVEANLLGPGQEYDGYEYASRLETELLLDSYYDGGTGDLHDDGVDVFYCIETSEASMEFLNVFGVTYVIQRVLGAKFRFGAEGDVNYEPTTGDAYHPYGYVFNRQADGYGWFSENFGTNADGGWYGIADNGSDSSVASLLVQHSSAPVPIPTTIHLLVAGLAGLAVFRKKFKK